MKSIKTIVEQIVIENNMENEILFARINEIWKNQFHPSMRNNVRIVKFKNRILYMQTDVSAIRQEIILRSSIIIEQFNSNLEKKIIKKIII
jgi:hypothetical protein